jgi:hypothetical protein
MFVKELKADYLGHHIAVRISWGPTASLKMIATDAKLYIDGKLVDTCSDVASFDSGAALMLRRNY